MLQQNEQLILQYLVAKLTRRACHMCDFLKDDMPDEMLRTVEAQSVSMSDMISGAMGYSITLFGDALFYNMIDPDDQAAADAIDKLVNKMIEVFTNMYGEIREAHVSNNSAQLTRIDDTEIYVKSHILVLTPFLRDMGKSLQWPMAEF